MTITKRHNIQEEINYSFALEIERIIQKKIGSNSWCSQWIRRFCYMDHEFSSYLESQPNDVRHYLSVICIGTGELNEIEQDIDKLAIEIRTVQRTKILKQIFDPYPIGLINAISKLGNKTWGKENYERLIKLLKDPTSRKIVCHMEKIPQRLINTLVSLDHELWIAPMIYNLTNKEKTEAFNYYIDSIRAVCPSKYHNEMFRSLKRIKEFDTLENWWSNWIAKAEFPKPPWEGSTKVRPITSGRQLIKASHEFENCLKSCVPEVLQNIRYYYCWKHKQKAIVGLVNDPFIGWMIEEIKGQKNRIMSKRTTKMIIDEFTNQGIQPRPSSRYIISI